MADSCATSVVRADVVALLAELLCETSTDNELCFHTICSLELPHYVASPPCMCVCIIMLCANLES